MPEDEAPAQLKEWFNEALYRGIARDLGKLASGFDRKRFLQMTLDGLPERSLMQRLKQTSTAIEASLPGSFRNKVDVLRELAPRIQHGFVAIFLSDFVAQYGLGD